MTRAEHLDWCKQRALEYAERGELSDAFASLVSDLRKHDGTRRHPAIKVGAEMLWSGQLNSVAAMRDFLIYAVR